MGEEKPGQARAWPDIAGRIKGDRHILPIRVYFEDTDFTGLVYHAAYLKWCERARSDFVRLLGIHHKDLAEPADGREPSAFVVRHLEIDYLRPASIDDLLEIVTTCAETGGATLTLHQKVFRGETLLAKLAVKIVLVSTSGKPMRLGDMISGAFAKLRAAKG